MSTQPVLFPVVLVADTDPLVRAVAAYLARFKDATRVHTESDLRAFLTDRPTVCESGACWAASILKDPGYQGLHMRGTT